MAVYPIEVVPSKTAFGLDQLRRSYKTDTAADAAAIGALGGADTDFPKMFLVSVNLSETAESATRADFIFHGCELTDVDGNPILPEPKHSSGNAVQSASSVSDGIVGHPILSFPVNIQFYAPTNTLEWISTTPGAAPPGGFAADPSGDPNIISMTTAEASIYALGLDVHTVLVTYFGYLFNDTIQSTEIVPGRYWSNVENKIRTIVTIPASTAVIP